jgi:hypothetical protein
MSEQWAFLTSNRFWALVIGAVAFYLEQKGIFGSDEMILIATITGGFIGIRTFDRASEKMGPQPETVILNELPKNGLPTPRSRQV